MDIIHAADMDETYGTYVDDECFDIHDYDDDTEDDTDDDTQDDAHADTNDDTADGGRGHLYTIKVPGCCSWVPESCCLSGCRPHRRRPRRRPCRRPCRKHTPNIFLGGRFKKTGAPDLFFWSS